MPVGQVLQLRQFNLQLAFARAGPLREDVEYEGCSVEYLCTEYSFQIAALRRRKLIVEDDCIHIVTTAKAGKLIRLALADERTRIQRFHLLHAVADNRAPCRGGQFTQFVQRIARVRAVARLPFHGHEENPFSSFVSGLD